MITLSDTAAVKVKELIESEGDPELALRVAVRPGGCSGMSYEMFFDKDIEQTDESRNENEGRAAALLLDIERQRADVDPGHFRALRIHSLLAMISATSTTRPSAALFTPALMTARLRTPQKPSVSGIAPLRTQRAKSSSSSRMASFFTTSTGRATFSPRLRCRRPENRS